ncbi:MAG: hypothetical protein ACI4SG_05510 [Oligosphaeraceae bacterium]
MPSTPSSNLQAARELLADNDESLASLAMDSILKGGKAEETLALLQDEPDKNVRRRAHQLGTLLQHNAILDKLVKDYEQARVSALEALAQIDLLYDTSSSSTYLRDLLRNTEKNFRKKCRGPLTPQKLCSIMEDEGFFVPPMPWIAIEDYLLGDVLGGDGGAAPLVLSILSCHLAALRGLDAQVVFCNGFIGFLSKEWVCLPEHGWQCQRLQEQDEICPLHDQQILQLYLSQLLTGAIASWEVYDTHLFLEILQRLDGLPENPLPYPYGPGEKKPLL